MFPFIFLRIVPKPRLAVENGSVVRGTISINEQRFTDKNVRCFVTSRVMYKLSSNEVIKRAGSDVASLALSMAENR